MKKMKKCEWTKPDFLYKQLGIVWKHMGKCKDPDCLGKKHLRFHTRNASHPLGTMNVRARKYRVWRDRETSIAEGENLQYLDLEGWTIIERNLR